MICTAQTSQSPNERAAPSAAWLHGSVENKQQVIDANGIGSVVAAMGAHTRVKEVQIQGLVALANLAAGDNTCKDEVVSADGCAACARAAVALPDCLELQVQAMRLLANLTASKPEAVVGASGAVPAAALAMAVHWEDSGLVWLGARVLANVAELATGVLAVCDAGGAAAVVCALEAHGTEEEVQAEGCRALANLAFDAPDSSAKHGESEAPTWREVGKAAVQEALRQQGLQATDTRAASLEVTAAEAYLRLTGDAIDVGARRAVRKQAADAASAAEAAAAAKFAAATAAMAAITADDEQATPAALLRRWRLLRRRRLRRRLPPERRRPLVGSSTRVLGT